MEITFLKGSPGIIDEIRAEPSRVTLEITGKYQAELQVNGDIFTFSAEPESGTPVIITGLDHREFPPITRVNRENTPLHVERLDESTYWTGLGNRSYFITRKGTRGKKPALLLREKKDENNKPARSAPGG